MHEPAEARIEPASSALRAPCSREHGDCQRRVAPTMASRIDKAAESHGTLAGRNGKYPASDNRKTTHTVPASHAPARMVRSIASRLRRAPCGGRMWKQIRQPARLATAAARKRIRSCAERNSAIMAAHMLTGKN